jgi:predicted metalloprotease with PDZ domain
VYILYLFLGLVCVDHVDNGSPAFIAGLRKADVVLAVQGVRVNALSQASKLLKAGGNRFSLRVERRRSLVSHVSFMYHKILQGLIVAICQWHKIELLYQTLNFSFEKT